MNTVNLTLGAPKEVVDYLAAFEALAAQVAAKTPLAEIAGAELESVVKLASEFDAMKADVVAAPQATEDAVALYGRRIVYRLLGKQVQDVTVS